MRYVQINLDRTIDILDIPSDQEALDTFHEIVCWELEFCIIFNDGKTLVSYIMDEEARRKELPPNALATSLRGLWTLQDYPILGPVVLHAMDADGTTIDVPQVWIDLLQTIIQITKGV